MTQGRTLARVLMLAAAIAVLPLAACGSDDDAASKDPAKLTITAGDSGKKVSLAVSGDKTPGTTDITVVNNGKRPHGIQLIAVNGDHSQAEVVKAYKAVSDGKPAPDWFFAAGGAGTVGPGLTKKAGLVFGEATYYVFDDEDDANIDNGGVAELKIEGDKNEAKLPTGGGTITAKDYSFTASGLKAGKNTLVFTNQGRQWHHVQAFPLKKGVTLAQVKKFMETEGKSGGPPPIDFEGGTGTSVIEGGGTETQDIQLQKGKYALVCFVSDRQGGPPHVAKGMISEATVD